MRKLLTISAFLLVWLVACYGYDDAASDVRASGGVDPIHCVQSGGGHSQVVYDCNDRLGVAYRCSRGDGCVVTWRPDR